MFTLAGFVIEHSIFQTLIATQMFFMHMLPVAWKPQSDPWFKDRSNVHVYCEIDIVPLSSESPCFGTCTNQLINVYYNDLTDFPATLNKGLLLKPTSSQFPSLDMILIDYRRRHMFGIQVSITQNALVHFKNCVKFLSMQSSKTQWEPVLNASRPSSQSSEGIIPYPAKFSAFHQPSCSLLGHAGVKRPRSRATMQPVSSALPSSDASWKYFFVYMCPRAYGEESILRDIGIKEAGSDLLDQWDASFVAFMEDNACFYHFLSAL